MCGCVHRAYCICKKPSLAGADNLRPSRVWTTPSMHKASRSLQPSGFEREPSTTGVSSTRPAGKWNGRTAPGGREPTRAMDMLSWSGHDLNSDPDRLSQLSSFTTSPKPDAKRKVSMFLVGFRARPATEFSDKRSKTHAHGEFRCETGSLDMDSDETRFRKHGATRQSPPWHTLASASPNIGDVAVSSPKIARRSWKPESERGHRAFP